MHVRFVRVLIVRGCIARASVVASIICTESHCSLALYCVAVWRANGRVFGLYTYKTIDLKREFVRA